MIYELMRRGKRDKETLIRRMSQLDLCGAHGRISSCYVTWLLLKSTPDCPEKQFHMNVNTLKLRAALQEEESHAAELVEAPAEKEALKTLHTSREILRAVQRVA